LTVEDSGALSTESPVQKLAMGDMIVVKPYQGRIETESGEVLSEFTLWSEVLLDEAKAVGRIPPDHPPLPHRACP
jgi:aconitate hydratase 2/2-methylisocitrate dehydratase